MRFPSFFSVPPRPTSLKSEDIKILLDHRGGIPQDAMVEGSMAAAIANYFNGNLKVLLDKMLEDKIEYFQKRFSQYVTVEEYATLQTKTEISKKDKKLALFPEYMKKAPTNASKKKINYPIYTDDYIKTIFDKDNDFSGFFGPGFEYMKEMDDQIIKKKT